MKRTRAILALVAVLGGGAATSLGGPYMSQYWNKSAPADGVHWGPQFAPEVPTMMGAWGEPVPMVAPYNMKPPNGADAARAMLQQSMPMDLLQQSGYLKDSSYPIIPVGGQCPGGACPAPMISPPGISGFPAGALPPGLRPPGAVAAVGALTGANAASFPVQRTEVRFVGPPGMKISWYGPTADGKGGFGPQYLEAPARYNFLQASIYRLKLSDIPNRPGVELYPTLEVVPAKPKTCTFLAHSAVPVVFTEEDFEQVAAGNFVVKVIYLPDPQFQDLAATGPDEVVSSRLEPGVDPIVEAKRRGCFLLVVRLGNIDLEAPNTPAMDAPNPFRPQAAACPPGQVPPGQVAPGQVPPGQVPPGAMAPGLPGQPPMVPYGMLNGQPPMPGMPPGGMPPGMPPMPGNPGLAPGQMLPSMPGAPASSPVGTQFPGAPGMPVSQATPSGGVQPAQYQPASTGPSTTKRPTTASPFAGQTSTWGSSPTPGSR